MAFIAFFFEVVAFIAFGGASSSVRPLPTGAAAGGRGRARRRATRSQTPRRPRRRRRRSPWEWVALAGKTCDPRRNLSSFPHHFACLDVRCDARRSAPPGLFSPTALAARPVRGSLNGQRVQDSRWRVLLLFFLKVGREHIIWASAASLIMRCKKRRLSRYWVDLLSSTDCTLSSQKIVSCI